jgi:hypothetical protein
MQLLIMQFSPTSCHFIPLRSKYSPKHNWKGNEQNWSSCYYIVRTTNEENHKTLRIDGASERFKPYVSKYKSYVLGLETRNLSSRVHVIRIDTRGSISVLWSRPQVVRVTARDLNPVILSTNHTCCC